MTPEGRLYGPLTLSLGIGLTAMGMGLAIQMLGAVIGPFRISEGERSALSGIAVWVPSPSNPTAAIETRDRLRAWRHVIPAGTEVFESHALEELLSSEPRAIAVLDARSIEPGELESLLEFAEGGGALIVWGAVAVRWSDGRWRGFDEMRRLLNVRSVYPLGRDASIGLRSARRGPLSAGLAPDRRVALAPQAGVPAIDDPNAELRWADASGPAGASRFRQVRRGRLVWLAAGPESLSGSAASADFARLVRAAVAWSTAQPFVEVLPWPDRSSFAVAVLATAERMSADAISREIARAARVGGLARLPATVAERAERSFPVTRGAWIAPEKEIVRWRRRREGVIAAASRVGPRRHRIEVTNNGRDGMKGLVLRIHLNAAVRRVDVDRTKLQQEEPVIELDLEAQQLDLRLPEVPGRSSLAYTLDMLPIGADPLP